MPVVGSQIILCDLPVRFDTYRGCSHACDYCFARRKADLSHIKTFETSSVLRRFINGYRPSILTWADWDIPLHWGGVSDPFQPAEATYRRSLQCLRLFAETGYPVVFSTKGALVVSPPYLDLVRAGNMAAQVSLVAPSLALSEPGAPSFPDRLRMLETLSGAAKRTIVRCQPYFPALHDEVLAAIPSFASAGAHGFVLEAFKRQISGPEGLVRLGGEYVYPLETLRPRFLEIRDAVHQVGMRFYSGENRLRTLGDSLCCCGVSDLPGWRVNTLNLNHLLYDPDSVSPSPGQLQVGSSECFKTISQKNVSLVYMAGSSLASAMFAAAKTSTLLRIMGVDSDEPER